MEEQHHSQPQRGVRRAVISVVALCAVLASASGLIVFRVITPTSQSIIAQPVPLTIAAFETTPNREELAATTPEQSQLDTPNDSVSEPQETPTSKLILDRFIGTWAQERFGRRTLTIRPDGTALMIIEPNDFFALAYGKRIEIELAWQFNGERAVYRITGGNPADKLELAKKSWGDAWDEPVVDVTDNSFVLVGADGSRCEWRRSEMNAEPTRKPNDL